MFDEIQLSEHNPKWCTQKVLYLGDFIFSGGGGAGVGGSGKISVTDASGKPYSRGTTNGSTMSMTPTLSSNGSTITPVVRSPLRSSLKKPRSANGNVAGGGLGIQNPGFSGTSPTLSRNGSVKKVRIQTQSTAV